MDDELQERHEPAPAAHGGDPLDEAVVPLFGLSGATLVAIFVGGAFGTIARYLLEAHHPVARARSPG